MEIMIEVERGMYIIRGGRYVISPKDHGKILRGVTLEENEQRCDFRKAGTFEGIVKTVENGTLVLSPATENSSYAVDFGHYYAVTTRLEEVRIPLDSIDMICGM